MEKVKFSLKTKLLLSFLLVALITMIIGGQGVFIIVNTNKSVQEIKDGQLRLLLEAEYLAKHALTHRRYEKDFFLNIGAPDKQKSYLKKFDSISNDTQSLFSSIEQTIHNIPHLSVELTALLHQGQAAYSQYRAGFQNITQMVQADKNMSPQAANTLMKPVKQNIYRFEKSLSSLAQEAETQIAFATDLLIKRGKQATLFISLLLGIGIVLNLILGILLSNAITTSIRKAAQFAKQLADGDFTHTLTLSRKDEVGWLIQALNTASWRLSETMHTVSDGVDLLHHSSAGLATIAGTQTQNTKEVFSQASAATEAAEEMSTQMNTVAAASEQASVNINMVASATEEMGLTVQEIADNTTKARNITQQAVLKTEKVSEQVDELGDAAQEITKVTETITEISEQTNLLALNATIEAARAGEAGKGFAIVANEIKELAKQTAEATLDIKGKIETIQSSTGATVSEVTEINAIVTNINDIVSAIAIAIEEQSSTTNEIASNVSQAAHGITEVNKNVARSSDVSSEIFQKIASVSKVTRQVQNDTRLIDDQAKDLKALAENLQTIVRQFQLA